MNYHKRIGFFDLAGAVYELKTANTVLESLYNNDLEHALTNGQLLDAKQLLIQCARAVNMFCTANCISQEIFCEDPVAFVDEINEHNRKLKGHNMSIFPELEHEVHDKSHPALNEFRIGVVVQRKEQCRLDVMCNLIGVDVGHVIGFSRTKPEDDLQLKVQWSRGGIEDLPFDMVSIVK